MYFKTVLVSSVLLFAGVASGIICAGDPQEDSGKSEDDMFFLRKRNGVINPRYRWRNGQICYTISPAFNQTQVELIKSTVATGFTGTCIKWVECQSCCNGDYVYITNDHKGCSSSSTGRAGVGRQLLNLAKECLYKGTMLHEMLHVVGFKHQHSSPERDDYVTIKIENVMDGFEIQFGKYTPDYLSSFGQPYDYCSIMHYHETAFSKNGKPTIVPKLPTTCKLGAASELSPIDKLKVNAMYKCGL
ncbi:hypothetical protein PPYR_00538 [Photinus pyralis]|uniref:Metalloendopeptidase n=2 Tax=Photinus pyralis TaxID=7054 RepID=A0A5N4B219_PHOPY|nr:zinc metalloproteinase nas-15-like [Photinus pyralis]KAB0803568.1 hypothetical protein PPYR_00538 [Photinus pyralis]